MKGLWISLAVFCALAVTLLLFNGSTVVTAGEQALAKVCCYGEACKCEKCTCCTEGTCPCANDCDCDGQSCCCDTAAVSCCATGKCGIR